MEHSAAQPGRIVVLGAGSIGVYVGLSLVQAGADVVLLGRPGMAARLAQGARLTDLQGRQVDVPGARIAFSSDAAVLAQARLILLTVKRADSANAAAQIAAHAPREAIVLSLQNGIGNGEELAAALPGRTVVAGMVPFNVAQIGSQRFHRGTEGELMAETAPALAPWLDVFAAANLPLQQRADFVAVQWGKLLLNLNNAVNALSDLPLKTQLSQRAYRRCLALLMDEALAALRVAGIAPARLAKIGPRLLPGMLRLPDWLFLRLAKAMLKIDPQARSSMWEDLQAGRRTEIDYLNGAVVALAARHGVAAPANARMVALVHAAEQGGRAGMDGDSLLAALHGQACGQPAQKM